MLDISDGDYLLESLREFRPPSQDKPQHNLSIFEGKKGGKKGAADIEFIAGIIPGKNDRSLEELKFFEKPPDADAYKDDAGFMRPKQK